MARRRHHVHHHFVDPRSNHGVTSPLWHLVFRTYRRPDVIVVGELRDPETLAIALTAAETGHLVLGKVHAPGAAGAIDRSSTRTASTTSPFTHGRVMVRLCPCTLYGVSDGAKIADDE